MKSPIRKNSLATVAILLFVACFPTSQPTQNAYTVAPIATESLDPFAGTESKILLGTRWAARGAFEDIFGASTVVGATTVGAIVKSFVVDQPVGWGGPCDPYANGHKLPRNGFYELTHDPAQVTERGCAETSHSKSALIPSGSTSRFAWTIRVCDRITSSDAAIAQAALKSGYTGSMTAAPSDQNIRDLYGIFYLGQEPSAEVMAALREVVADASAKYPGTNESWRFLVLTVCSSPGWQIL